MYRKLSFVFFIVGLLVSNNLKADTVLYCISELATGISKEEDTWTAGNFVSKRFTLRFNKDFSVLEGAAIDPLKCTKPFSHKPDIIACIDYRFPYQPFLYEKAKKRFVFSQNSSGGYIDNGADTDSMYAGTCQNF